MLYTLQKLIAAQSNQEPISYSQVKGDAAEGRNKMLICLVPCVVVYHFFYYRKNEAKAEK